MMALRRQKLTLLYFVYVVFGFNLCESVTNKNKTSEVVQEVKKNLTESESNGKFETRMLGTKSNLPKKNNGLSDALFSKFIEKTSSHKTKPLRKELNHQNLQKILGIVDDIENDTCREDCLKVVQGLMNYEEWALQMFDASPKFPTGLLYGNMYALGNFDECTSIRQTIGPSRTIEGQYCLTNMRFKLRETNETFDEAFIDDKNNFRGNYNSTVIHWAMCLPSTCSSADGELFMSKIFEMFIEFRQLNVSIGELDCHHESNKHTISTGQIIYGALVILVAAIILLATWLHYWYIRRTKNLLAHNLYSVDHLRQKNSPLKETILAFSLIQNVSNLLQTKPNEYNLECICGIKFLSMMFILAGHSLIFIFGSPISNVNFANEMSESVENTIFLNSPLLVDSFLLVSGLLMARLLLPQLDKRRGKINVLMLYLIRYIRLTPAYLVIIGLNLTWLPYLGKGPLWRKITETEQLRCSKSWWTNLLYINNYVQTENLCMFQAWYLAADFHLFIIAPIFLFLLWKWPKWGLSLLTVIGVSSAILPGYLTYANSYDPTLLAFPPEIEDLATNYYFTKAYIKTHMRANSYFIGLLCGYLIHWMQKECIKISDWILWIGWVLAAFFSITSMCSVVWFLRPTYVPNDLVSSVYAALHRLGWALSIGWFIIVCVTENANPVNKLLSWKFFMPLSRLTYSAYLVNGVVLICYKGLTREAISWTKFGLASVILGHLVITFSIAFVLCVCFESPIHGLNKILMGKKDASDKTSIQPPPIFRIFKHQECK